MTSGGASIKHWRAFGPAEWGHVREGAIGLALGSLLPVGLFYVTYRLFEFTAAVVVVLIWSALVFLWHWQRTRSLDIFSATTFVFAVTKAAAGLFSQNPTLYLAWPSLDNMIYGLAFFVSALLGAPLLAQYAQRLYPIPDEVRATRAFRRAFLVVSAAWLVGHSLRAIVRLILLFNLPLEWYLIADTVAGWPINSALVAITVWYPLRTLRRAGFMDAKPFDMTTVDAIELGVEEAASTGTV